ncbi:MAG: hypothetical protein KZQ99_20515 [Candidatus Thiodiazotropha sp. (ex Dulcina madagascariensis)]|nr:hypothetical protein [Candidatus Thiodiazotropha sp. (ex Dulcina madagascariensis)]
MQTSENGYEPTCSELYNLQKQRDQMLIFHNQLLKQVRCVLDQKPAITSALSNGDYEAVLLQCRQLIDKQCKRIDELGEIESAYEHLSFEYSILEATNKELVEQLHALGDQVVEKDELERLVEVQHKSIHALRKNLRELEFKHERSMRQFHVSRKENRELRTMLEQHRSSLSPFFAQQRQMKGESNRLRRLLRNQEISYTQLVNEYGKLRAEYKALYENISQQKNSSPNT